MPPTYASVVRQNCSLTEGEMHNQLKSLHELLNQVTVENMRLQARLTEVEKSLFSIELERQISLPPDLSWLDERFNEMNAKIEEEYNDAAELVDKVEQRML